MKPPREIMIGAVGGLALGLFLRLTTVFLSTAESSTDAKTPLPSRNIEKISSDSQLEAEIRQSAFSPSNEAREAVQNGVVKFVIRPGTKSSNADVAKILLRLGAIPLVKNGEGLSVWDPNESRWEQVRSAEKLSGYAIGRAWEMPDREVIEEQTAKLPASVIVFLALPTDQELMLVGAVEHALKPHLIVDYARIELALENTGGGHIQWTLQRAVSSDSSEINPNIILPI